ncbi:ERG2 and Sigma1 receptor like protein-domain-containing protein [Aspergillus welwitschiae]|uniref:Cytoplasmic tRNA 2-thiolation protein 1 n=1 Tax=Aspergillus welwitschiae TaxID=1341132 RepID=A0A3F3Q1F4_9EURO|nr:ERG2 and Sigma1 receptor like protein-domain-containing protein [Aspergillus welwitschiae]RDH33039.1 ERG2 and Sigma1 receptor like protein-domain-containing protein [Aspergillus welwitschiae]
MRCASFAVALLALFSGLYSYLNARLEQFYIFDPSHLHDLSQRAIAAHGNDTRSVVNFIVSELGEKVTDTHLNLDEEWVFNNAGGAMGAMYIIHASTAIGTEGHTGRHTADDYFNILQGTQLAYVPGSYEPEVYPQGSVHHLRRGEVKQYKMDESCFALEYARGWIPPMLFFGYADTFSSTLDFPTLWATSRITVHETITSTSLFHPGERVAIGASGGKDSTVLAAVLKTLNERYNYGLDLCLLSIDEGIKGYRDDSLETVKRNAQQYNMPLVIVSYGDLYGWTMDQVVAQVGKKGNCTYCGVFRRQALDRGAAKLGIKHVVTGHNADDVAETVMMNLLRGDLPRLSRGTSIVTGSAASDIKRSKPLKYAYEKEIVLYAHHRQLDYFSTECIYSPEAFRGSARTLIKDLEKIRPSSILDIVKSGEDMALLVPAEVRGKGAEDEEGGGGGGCGSQNGRTRGGEMAEMERKLKEDEAAKDREMEITSDSLSRRQQQQQQQQQSEQMQTPAQKKVKSQVLGTCERCGYISSQRVCKACTLLEGLNKNRPKTAIEMEIGLEDEESSSTLRRQMEKVELGGV